MKKLLCMALCLIMVFSLCACGGNDTPAGSGDSDTGVSTEANTNKNETPKFVNDDGTIIRPEYLGGKTELKSSTTFENEIVKVYIYAFSSWEKTGDRLAGASLTLKIENKSNKKLFFEVQGIDLNGLTMDNSYHTEIEVGETDEESFQFSNTMLSESGISKIFNGKVYFWAKAQGDTEQNYFESITFETTEKGEQVNYTEGKTVYEKNGIKIVLQNTGWVDNEIGYIRFYVENTTDQRCSIEFTKMKLTGDYDTKDEDDLHSKSFDVMAKQAGYYTYWMDKTPYFDYGFILPVKAVSLETEIVLMDMNSRGLSGEPDDTFTVEITDWDWSAISK